MLTKKEQRLRRARQNTHPHCTARRGTFDSETVPIFTFMPASVSGDGSKVLASASTAEADVRKELGATGKGGNANAAQLIGKRIAEKAKAAGVEKVAFDRAGFAFHGRVKALAEAAREAGLQF